MLGSLLLSLALIQDPVAPPALEELSCAGLVVASEAGARYALRPRRWSSTDFADEVAGAFAAWRLAHPDATPTVLGSVDGGELGWLVLRDGEHWLGASLVAAGLSTAQDMLGPPGRAPADYVAAVELAEAQALEQELGVWSRRGPRRFRLGQRCALAGEDRAALDHFAAARRARFDRVLLSIWTQRCRRALGDRGAAARLADERALASASGAADYDATLLATLRERAQESGAAAAIALARELWEWEPRRLEHALAVATLLGEHGASRQAVDLLGEELRRLRLLFGFDFDAQDRVYWDDVLAEAPSPAVHSVQELLPLYRLAVRLAGDGAGGPTWLSRAEVVERVVVQGDVAAMATNPFPVARQLTAAELVAALRSVHPTARRDAATEVLRRLAAADAAFGDPELAACAGAALDLQRDRAARWCVEAGAVVEAAWARGLLEPATQRRYLAESAGELVAFAVPAADDPTTVQVSLWQRGRRGPPPGAAAPPRAVPSSRVVVEAASIDGRPVAVIGAVAAALGEAGVPFVLDWPSAAAGRHRLELWCRVEISARVADGPETSVRRLLRASCALSGPSE